MGAFFIYMCNHGHILLFSRFRHYGLWDRYTELYPDTDLVYTVGVSDYSKDWFFAQVPRCDSSISLVLFHFFGWLMVVSITLLGNMRDEYLIFKSSFLLALQEEER